MIGKKIIGLFVLGLLLILIGFILGKSSVRQLADNNQETLTPSSSPPIQSRFNRDQSGQAPFITQLQSKTQSNKLYRVVKVIDGDTIQVEVSGKTETLRLIGIDAPETGDPRTLVSCFGNEATSQAKEILAGRSVRLEADPTQGERDKYQRLLRYVFLEDGTNFNKLMISQGFAHEYTYRIPYKYQLEFKEAQNQAREKKLGLWADDACSNAQSNVQSEPSKAQVAGNYTCDCSKLCSQISTCEEAYFQLNQCGCTKRDSDKDGIPCESLCK
ncbi:MAG: thermonuclease family protein [Candidatus Levybacteria bacterium]|nr:thermonuclease family protein [Candidatus Levybacteria bacterium]